MKLQTKKEAFQSRNQNYINKSATFEMGMSSQGEEEEEEDGDDDYFLYFSLFEMLFKRNYNYCAFLLFIILCYYDM